jgi:phage tail-like protein
MSAAAYLPRVPAPPHDPYSFRLDARAGFRPGLLEDVEVAPDGTLALVPLPGVGPQLAEPNGTLGGLVLPSVVALDGRDVYLLDRARGLILRFDRCECRFGVVPCIGGLGSGPRQVLDPGGIGIACGNLFVCDTQNHRLHVYMLRGLQLRGHWRPPPNWQAWAPMDVAFDRSGRVYVADSAHGAVHVFSPLGRWLTAIDGLGAVRHLAVDRCDRLYVVLDGDPDVRVLRLDGLELARVRRPDAVAKRFAPLPFPVTAEGYLGLGAWCVPPRTAYFDLTGAAVTLPPPKPIKLYPQQGRYLSEALDSRLYQCVWDRVGLFASLGVSLGAGMGIGVRTYSSETEQPLDIIAALPDEAWETNQRVGAANGEWDCLLRSAPGRFLWLRLDLTGDGFATPRIQSLTVDFPRISLSRYLPGVYRAEPTSADFTDRFLAVFDRGFRQIEAEVDGQAQLFDPLSAPAGDVRRGESDFLGWLASWVGITLTAQWPLARRRCYLKEVAKLFCMRGTRTGLRRQLLLFLGVPSSACSAAWRPPPLLLEHFQTRRWLFVGAGRLGEHARLWGKGIVARSQLDENAQLDATRLDTSSDPLRDPFHVHAHRFTAFLPARLSCSEGEKRAVRRLIELERPGHSAFDIRWVEPRMRIGIQSMIGYDAVIGSYPGQNIVVDEAHLGRATMVGGSPHAGPTMRVGHDARVGTTTKLG